MVPKEVVFLPFISLSPVSGLLSLELTKNLHFPSFSNRADKKNQIWQQKKGHRPIIIEFSNCVHGRTKGLTNKKKEERVVLYFLKCLFGKERQGLSDNASSIFAFDLRTG